MLQRECPLMAQSRHAQDVCYSSAFGGEADMILRRRIELSPGGDNEFSIKNNLLLWPVVVSQATGGNGPTIAAFPLLS
jgi:hypothetical protein